MPRMCRRASLRSLAVGLVAALGTVLLVPVAGQAGGALTHRPSDRRAHAPVATRAAFVPLSGNTAVQVVLLGDSIGLTLGRGLGWGAPSWGVDLTNGATIGCDLDWNSTVNFQGNTTNAAQGCADWPTAWQNMVATLNPDVVALELGRWEVSNRLINGQWYTVGQAPWDDLYASLLSQAIQILSSRGAKVVLFTLPYIAQTTNAPDGQPWDINQPVRTDAFNALTRQVAAQFPGTVTVIDINAMLDPDGTFSAYLGGFRTRDSDNEHISPVGGILLQPDVLPQLAALGRAHDAQRNGLPLSQLAPATSPGT